MTAMRETSMPAEMAASPEWQELGDLVGPECARAVAEVCANACPHSPPFPRLAPTHALKLHDISRREAMRTDEFASTLGGGKG